MANGTIPRPDAFVEQVFGEATPALLPPPLPVVVIGTAKQIEFRQQAGSYAASTAATYAYPNLLSGASVDLASVEAFLFTSDGTFQLDSGDFSATASGVQVLSYVTTSDFVTEDQVNGEIQGDENIQDPTAYEADGAGTIATKVFTSLLSDFVAAGVKAGNLLEIIDDGGGGADNLQYRVDEVTDLNTLVLRLEPEDEWTGFTAGITGATFRVIADWTTFKDETVDFQQLGIVGGLSMGVIIDGARYRVEFVKSATELAINPEQLGALSVTTIIGTPGGVLISGDFTDEILPGDKIVIETGADAGIYEADTVVYGVPNTTVTFITGDDITAATTEPIHTFRPLTAAVDVAYSIDENRTDRNGTILLSYDADRTDLSGVLTQIQDTDDLNNTLGASVPENPLAFGAFWALQNTGTTVFVIGINSDTVAEHASALDILGNEEVYALAPLTQDSTVHQLYAAHVTAFSAVDAKRERIVFLNRELFVQETKIDEADGTSAVATNATPPANDSFVDSGADFTTDGIIAGDEITWTYTPDGGSVTTQTIRVLDRSNSTTLLLIEGLPSIFFTDWAAGSTTAKTYTIKSRSLDKFEQAEFIRDYSKAFANRRVYNIWPDLAEFTYTDNTRDTDFLTQAELTGTPPTTGDFTGVFPGYYLSSVYGGLVAGQPPQQPFTNVNVVGPTGLRNSNRYFTETQMDIIASGGTFIVIQEAEDTPVFCRHQLSTDVTIIEKRELSITKDVDFIAKFFRNQLRPYVGNQNITTVYLEQLKIVVNSLIERLVADGQLISGSLITLRQSDEESDTVLVEVDILVPFPANYIRVTLFI